MQILIPHDSLDDSYLTALGSDYTEGAARP